MRIVGFTPTLTPKSGRYTALPLIDKFPFLVGVPVEPLGVLLQPPLQDTSTLIGGAWLYFHIFSHWRELLPSKRQNIVENLQPAWGVEPRIFLLLHFERYGNMQPPTLYQYLIWYILYLIFDKRLKKNSNYQYLNLCY